MTDKSTTAEVKPTPPEGVPVTPPAPRRGPGHRGADVRDTVAEMAAKAQEISQEAGSKVAAAMKDVINAAAGIAGFAVESARDLVQYMVRRGQMTQEEADKLLREAEEAHVKRGGQAGPPLPPRRTEPETRRPESLVRTFTPVTPAPKPVVAAPVAKPAKAVAKAPVAKKAAASKVARSAAKGSSAKAKKAGRPAAKKAPAKKK